MIRTILSNVIKNPLLSTFLFLSFILNIGQGQPLIIFDTDMGPDYDDAGAIAVLHALEAKGECKILATIASDSHPLVAPTIDVLNTYFGRGDLPVGTAPVDAPYEIADNHWNDSLVANYPSKHNRWKFPVAVDLYREILASHPDQSITIVTVGFTSNLAKLLDTPGDQYSDLTGKELVRKKVKKWVAMAGAFPEGREFNVFRDTKSSLKVFREWPTPVLFSGFEIGIKIMTGQKTSKIDPTLNNPVQWAYAYNLKTYTKNGEVNRPSWDHTAVLCAIRDPEQYFYVEGPGQFIIHEDGSNSWDPETDSRHYFLVHKYPYHVIEEILEDLMGYIPDR